MSNFYYFTEDSEDEADGIAVPRIPEPQAVKVDKDEVLVETTYSLKLALFGFICMTLQYKTLLKL